MVVVGRRQNFFRRPFSVQICKKMYYLYTKKVEDQKKVLTYFLGLYNTIFVGLKPLLAQGLYI